MLHIGRCNCTSIVKPYFVSNFPSTDALLVLLLLPDGVNHEIYHVISSLHSSRFPHCNDLFHLIEYVKGGLWFQNPDSAQVYEVSVIFKSYKRGFELGYNIMDLIESLVSLPQRRK